jgi:hypothetical protein
MAVATKETTVQSSQIHRDVPEFPKIRALDPKKIEVRYDSDLDEFMVLFFGRDRPHALHFVDDNLYALIDPKTRELVGMELHNFVKKVVPRHPVFGSALNIATIISDETYGAEKDTSAIAIDEGFRYRLYERWKRIVTPRNLEIRELLNDLRNLSATEIRLQP